MERFRYLIAIALFTPSITIAASFPDFPSNSILQDTSGGRSAIEVGCEPTDRSSPTVKCRFYQFTVSYELNPEDYQIKLNEEIAKIESGKYFDAIDPVTAMRELCKQMNTVEVKAGIAEKYKTQPKSVPRFKKYLTLLNKGCEVKNVGEAKLLAIEIAQFTLKEQTKTCKVWPNIWEESFQSRLTSAGRYWLSTTEPKGDCGVVNLSTLRKDDEYFWKYESNRIITNKEAKMGLLSCSDIPERKIIYTWDPREYEVMCEVIKFKY